MPTRTRRSTSSCRRPASPLLTLANGVLPESTGQNAIAVVAQLALCTIEALSQHLGAPGQLGHLSPLREWELAGQHVW